MAVDIPDIERIVFFPGQPLTADDMTELEATNRELRWLHNRSLHPWGIGIGLEVSGEKGATAVKVQPGYAVDRLGRELVLSSVTTVPIPAVPGSPSGGDAVFYLILRYLPDNAQVTLETRKGVCRPGGSVRLSDRPALEWRTTATLQDGLDLVLASIRVKNCMLAARVLLTARRMVSPPQLSYVAGGRTAAGATDWKPFTSGGQILGQMVRVDSSEARFRNIPQYSITVLGSRVRPSPLLIAVGISEIVNPAANEFTVHLLFPQLAGAGVNPAELRHATAGPKTLNDLGWSVSWIGVEG